MELIKTIGMSFSFDDLDNTILTQIEAHFDMHFSSGRNPSRDQRAASFWSGSALDVLHNILWNPKLQWLRDRKISWHPS